MKKNIVQETRELMERLQQRKADDLAMAEEKISENMDRVAAADKEIESATRAMDTDAYTAAVNSKNAALTALEMYSKRLDQIRESLYTTEEESDSTIDKLLAYENQLEEEYMETVAPIISSLEEINSQYLNKVDETEKLIREWTYNIHPNYRSPGTIYADGSNRSPNPVPVHRIPYTGCRISTITSEYIFKCEQIKARRNDSK